MIYRILLILVSLWCTNGKSVLMFSDEDINCGYKACHPIKEGRINIHLVPHSHDDVGWVKTIDQYYYGVPVGNYVGAVQYIYQSVLSSLKRYSNRRFILVETAFFWKWWQLQDEKTREDFTELVTRGQIEFTGGGWSMNDEAVVNYQSTIDQITWGLRRLNDTFGDCGRPRMGWQIDPFGHSSEMASIFAQLGYDGVVLGRIDYQDKITRIHNKSMDMVWRGSKSLGENSDIFTSVLFNHYDAPDGFCYEMSCKHVPLVDDPESPEYNINQKARQLLANYVHFAIQGYSTSNLLIPMGQDFAYQNAEMWFMNMDKLIKYINGREIDGKQYNIMYSTPACYAYAVHNETKGILNANLKTDDFFPYASDKNAYWTGYYTSRPQIKRFERSANNFLQVSKQLFALAALSSDHEQQLNSLREAMGVLQHHDAITGTEKMVVANDYEKILSKAMNDCENLTNAALNSLISKLHHPRFEHCPFTNISQCSISESSNKFLVTIYNPLSRYVHKYVRLPVLGTSYKVLDPSAPCKLKLCQFTQKSSKYLAEAAMPLLNLYLKLNSFLLWASNHFMYKKN
ncbi:unnamed protein product [Ceutorhynchus assimilis]|uniref:alpha-mannosidase n=1 Tax=Ceutorhynchus assimilis TaxID=467358 RepID=A0A9N9MG17_9CUCU|nr:unnamed protein product [Ceutorhynchus assimilis]